MSQMSPWARVKLPLFILVILLLVIGVAWPYIYAPTKVLAACTISPVATPNALGAIQSSTLTATPSFSIGSVGEHPKIVISLSPLSGNVNQKIMAGFELILNKSQSAAASAASAIIVYKSDLQELQLSNNGAQATISWTIPSVPAGDYRVAPYLSDVATKLFGTNLRIVSQPLTVQSTITSFSWINPQSVTLSHVENRLNATLTNIAGVSNTLHLTAQVYEGLQVDPVNLKNTVKGDTAYAAEDISKDISLSLPGLSTMASANIQLVADFGNYKQYLQSRFGTDSAASLGSSTFTVKRSFLGHVSILSTCVNLPDIAIAKGSVLIRWYHGQTQVGNSTVDISTKVGQFGINATRFVYTNTPDHVRVDLLKDGQVLDSLTTNSAL